MAKKCHQENLDVHGLSRSSRRLPSPTTQAVKRDVNLIQFPMGKAGCFSDQNFVRISSKFYNNSDVLKSRNFIFKKVSRDCVRLQQKLNTQQRFKKHQMTTINALYTSTSFFIGRDDSSLVFFNLFWAEFLIPDSKIIPKEFRHFEILLLK